HRLLSFDNELKRAYEYYQNLILVIAHRSKKELKNLLAIKWTQLPQALQKVQHTLRSHKQEIYNSFKYDTYTNGPVEGTNNKIKV
ncbi:transposase, partial [Lactobacillus reuteri]